MAQVKDLIVNGSSRFIGPVYADTQSANDNSTKVATTQFVTTEINNALNKYKSS